MVVELTERQQSVVDYIRSYQEKFGISPTIREMCSHLGLNSPAGVHKILQKLIEKEILISLPGKKRSWRLTDGPARKTIPLFGHIAAGQPVEAIGDKEENLALDSALFGYEDCFALRVQGDSMIEAHIVEGDLAVIHPQNMVESGQIAALLVEDFLPEATLKIFYRIEKRIELHSANRLYPPLIFNDRERRKIKVLGKYVGVIRKAV